MKPYEKPNAEIISFESENIMTNPGIGEMPSFSEGVREW